MRTRGRIPQLEELAETERPDVGRMASWPTRSMVDFAQDRFRLVTDEQFQERMAVKPRGRAFRCPVMHAQ